MRLFLLSSLLLCAALLRAQTQNTLPRLDPARIAEIAGWLAPTPSTHFAPPFSDRGFWDAWKDRPAGLAFLRQAEKLATQPVPALTDELFHDYGITGQRGAFEKPFGDRAGRLRAFAFAEGLRNDGSYLPLIETELAAILDEPSWAVPAHSYGQGRKPWAENATNIDLAAAARAWDIATIDWLLGDRLRPETRDRLRKEVRARVLVPYLARIRAADRDGFWWMNGTNNWNAICHSGVVGAALLLDPEPAERAEFIAAFEACTPFFISGFSDDGMCLEGMGYWVYGFGHYILGSEFIRLATGGHVDLLSGEKTKRIAAFDLRWELVGGIYPAFGDAWIKTKGSPWMHDFAVLRYGTGELQGVDDPLQLHVLGAFVYRTLFDFALPRDAAAPRELKLKVEAQVKAPAGTGGTAALRDWFPDGGALLARRSPAAQGLAVAFKGGHNDQPHNHNDLGSFVVANEGVLVLTDLGADSYVKDTFGPRRYESGVMNSFGHPVPLVAGRLQKTGAAAKAVTVRTEFTAERDLWELDLSSAYEVPGLLQLTRTFIFSRGENGKLEIIDRVRFDRPQAFGTAVILRPNQVREPAGENRFRVTADGKAVDVTFSTESGARLVTKEEPIIGIVPAQGPRGTRIGIDLAQPAREAVIRLSITPVP